MIRSNRPPFVSPAVLADLFRSSAPATPSRASPSSLSSLAAFLASSTCPPAARTPSPSSSQFAVAAAALLGSSTRPLAESTLAPASSMLAAFLQQPSSSPISGPVSRPQWIAVRQRFEQFAQNLMLTRVQVDDGVTKCQGIVRCLNDAYYGDATAGNTAFTIGSWGKNTAIRPPRDVDLYFVLPAAVHARLEAYRWNRQSALLQEVKDALAATYPSTDMRGDGQVVVVNFESYAVEVIPAFLLTNGRYWICDTHNGGSYQTTDPIAERTAIEAADAASRRNLRPLVRMLKAWQDHCSVPIASFALELVAAEYIAQSPWRLNDFFYFDWLVRDFFVYLYTKAGQRMILPGTGEIILLGDDWKSRVVTAYGHAVEACDCERDNYVYLAGEEWQKIFGQRIPVSP
jgi:Second Messenger Oligonucleotide or Dinucleotide Synthetase domain